MPPRSFARVLVAVFAGDRTHPPKFLTPGIHARMQRTRRRQRRDVYLGLGYWLRRVSGDLLIATCRCEVWDTEEKRYQFATWPDAFRPTEDAEEAAFEYRGRMWRLMENDERGYPLTREGEGDRGGLRGRRAGSRGVTGVAGECRGSEPGAAGAVPAAGPALSGGEGGPDDAGQCGAAEPGLAVRPVEPGVPLPAGRVCEPAEHEVPELAGDAAGRLVHRRAGGRLVRGGGADPGDPAVRVSLDVAGGRVLQSAVQPGPDAAVA